MVDQILLDKTRYALFDTTAPRYNKRIVPAFGLLARRLVEIAALRSTDRVIDLGTATGTVAWQAAREARQVVGVDYAPSMLAFARQKQFDATGQKVTFHQANMHRLPYAAKTFQVALASFGFNGVDPGQTFPEIRRILEPGGRLVFQEWGEIEEASKLVKQAIKARRVARPEGFLADLRQLAETPDAWDELEDEEDVARLLRRSGFRKVKILIEREAIPFEPLAFYKYKTAWAPYQAELAAMSMDERLAVQAEVVDRIRAWCDATGRFIWKPELVRFIALK